MSARVPGTTIGCAGITRWESGSQAPLRRRHPPDCQEMVVVSQSIKALVYCRPDAIRTTKMHWGMCCAAAWSSRIRADPTARS